MRCGQREHLRQRTVSVSIHFSPRRRGGGSFYLGRSRWVSELEPVSNKQIPAVFIRYSYYFICDIWTHFSFFLLFGVWVENNNRVNAETALVERGNKECKLEGLGKGNTTLIGWFVDVKKLWKLVEYESPGLALRSTFPLCKFAAVCLYVYIARSTMPRFYNIRRGS